MGIQEFAEMLNSYSKELAAAQSRIAELEQEVRAYKKHGLEPCDYARIVVSENRAKAALGDLLTLMEGYTRLQAHDKEAMELLKEAAKSIPKNNFCQNCIHFYKSGGGCGLAVRRHMECRENNREHWRWQHADRYEALKSGGLK